MTKLHTAVLLAGTAAAALAGPALGQSCPSVEALRNYRPPEATRVYATDGSVLADYFDGTTETIIRAATSRCRSPAGGRRHSHPRPSGTGVGGGQSSQCP